MKTLKVAFFSHRGMSIWCYREILIYTEFTEDSATDVYLEVTGSYLPYTNLILHMTVSSRWTNLWYTK